MGSLDSSVTKMEESSTTSDPAVFLSLFPQLVSDLTETAEYADMPDTNLWLSRVLEYNVPHGKQSRGLTTALAFRYLSPDQSPEAVKLSQVLGWCVELFQAYLGVVTDLMNDTETRDGRLCWYKVGNLGASGFNDATLLESCVYLLLKKYFGGKQYYAELLEVFHDANHRTVYGQSLDIRMGLEKKLETYDMDHYEAIVKYKSSFSLFYLPIRLAMVVAGIMEPELVRQVRTLTLELGHYFQVQEDYLDCYGKEGRTGKDIEQCKISWLFVTAANKCNPEQKKILLANYGQNEPDKVDKVKQLHDELRMEEDYRVFEKETYNRISTHISQMNDKLPKQLFIDILNQIYGRKV